MPWFIYSRCLLIRLWFIVGDDRQLGDVFSIALQQCLLPLVMTTLVFKLIASDDKLTRPSVEPPLNHGPSQQQLLFRHWTRRSSLEQCFSAMHDSSISDES